MAAAVIRRCRQVYDGSEYLEIIGIHYTRSQQYY